ncbi:MAG: hypothetical protein FWC26_00800 [Fibromonadales bacterium]|nr:hypothetical protein [Fibromonadales bacterium]
MRTLSLRALCLLLVLGVQVFAQRFTTVAPDSFRTGIVGSGIPRQGYLPHGYQAAVLGEKKSSYANLMLLGNQDSSHYVTDSYGNTLGTVSTVTSGSKIGFVGAVAVMDSLSDSKKTATVLFASYNKLIVTQITVTEAYKTTYNILYSTNMPESMLAEDTYYPSVGRRLALLGKSQGEAGKTYHFAISNPLGEDSVGRVDFFSISENPWTLSQLNSTGLTSGVHGLFFERKACFGMDLVSISDLDKNGYNELAVLLPASPQYPNSAIYVFFMDNEYTPSSKSPVILTGNSRPWLELPERKQDCRGLGVAKWEDEATRLLVTCNANLISSNQIRSVLIKELALNSSGNIVNSSTFILKEIVGSTNATYNTQSNPFSIRNHKNDLNSVSLVVDGPINLGFVSRVHTFPVLDADYSKNFLLEAGKPETIVNLDSLFYKSGTSGFSVKTLFGLVQCGIHNSDLMCEGEENAIGSWSSLEISTRSDCDAYRECKRKDTIFAYVRSGSESPNTALRIPKSIVIPFFGQVNLGEVKPFSYFRNPNLLNTAVNWNTSGLKLSTVVGNFSIIPFSQKEGIDTLEFNLSISNSTNTYPVYLHVADTAKILEGTFQDTIWNTAQKRYIALPLSNTYDIAQDSLGIYAEIVGNYLHVLKVDVADVLVAYTENAQIKYRKITLMPEPKPLPPSSSSAQEPSSSSAQEPSSSSAQEPSSSSSSDGIDPIAATGQTQNLSVVQVKGGVQISGITGKFELVAYSLQGKELQRTSSQGSGFVKLTHSGAQIVRIRAGSQKIYFLHSN